MTEQDDDSRSDSSWLLANCDARSDSSWLCAGGPVIQQHGDDDMHSNASWNLVLDGDHSTTLQNQCRMMLEGLRIKSKPECFSDLDRSTPLTELIRAGRPQVALHLLRKSPDPSQLASQLDSSGDTPLSWTVYKAKRDNIAWLELTCELLILAPSHVQKQNTMRFLPLHDAAWGNAPAAIATALCAIFPRGVDVCAHGLTPHQLGHYQHTSRRGMFSWPAPNNMLQVASALSSEGEWMETIAALRPSSLDQDVLKSMSAIDLQSNLGIQPAIAELIACFFAPPRIRTPEWALAMPSIPERRCVRSQARPVAQTRLRTRSGFYRLPCPSPAASTHARPELACDDHHMSEPWSKDSGYHAGLRRARNSRCSFQELMVINDGLGGIHHVSLHAVRGMPKVSWKVKELKYASKKSLKRERQSDRSEKEYLRQT